MAIRRDELGRGPGGAVRSSGAVVYRFPTAAVRRRGAARRRRARALRLAVALVVTATVVVVAMHGWWGGTSVASRTGAPRSVTVSPGETLWDVAERFEAPGADPRAYVDRLVALNHLSGPVRAGQRLRLPQ